MEFNAKDCSVAIATYNGEKYIIEQLKSIENQTIVPNEVVIFDDCSKDNTVHIIREFQKTSKLNIVLNVNKDNVGFRKNFEQSIMACNNDIIFFCDQDDVWKNNKVEIFLKEFSNNNSLVYAFSNAYVTDENMNIIKDNEWTLDWTKFDRQGFFDHVQTRNFPLGFQIAAKRDFLHSVSPFLSDHDGWVAQCAPAFGEVKAITDKLVYYRRHPQATSGAHKNNKLNLVSLLNKICTTKYQLFFIYPNLEIDVYSKILQYAQSSQILQTTKIEEHLCYLSTLKDIECKNAIKRVRELRKLKKTGLYYEYRGNNNTFIIDCLFMIINSFKKNNKR